MLESIEKRITSDYRKLTGFFKRGKEKMKVEFNKSKVVAGELKENAEKALYDLRTGNVFSDDEAATNLKNTLGDSLKVLGMTGIFMLPGGSVGLIALRKLLRSKEAKYLHIENLLTLTIEEAKKQEEIEKKQQEESNTENKKTG
jgi:uncharacterized membrane-anchored protein